jgi:DMSO/TMAO reductase YedYZ molybdopterin-dependent catalytic subunit
MKKNRIPPGQRVTTNFPLLHISTIPNLTRTNWTLHVTGECDKSLKLDWNAFMKMDTAGSVSDFHCVTGWTRLDNHWSGVRIRDILDQSKVRKSARYITFRSADGYTTSLPIQECIGDDDILAFRWEGKDLDNTTGGPVRVVIPEKYAYKSALWVIELQLTKDQETGYWEQRGYSNSADPWKEERYSK